MVGLQRRRTGLKRRVGLDLKDGKVENKKWVDGRGGRERVRGPRQGTYLRPPETSDVSSKSRVRYSQS